MEFEETSFDQLEKMVEELAEKTPDSPYRLILEDHDQIDSEHLEFMIKVFGSPTLFISNTSPLELHTLSKSDIPSLKEEDFYPILRQRTIDAIERAYEISMDSYPKDEAITIDKIVPFVHNLLKNQASK